MLTKQDLDNMDLAIHLASKCPPSDTAYSVGAVLFLPHHEYFIGYSREFPLLHAEQTALLKAEAAKVETRGATLYSTMEPCSRRASLPKSCTQLIIEAGIARVIYCVKEPSLLVNCEGERILRENNIEVLRDTRHWRKVMEANKHLPIAEEQWAL